MACMWSSSHVAIHPHISICKCCLEQHTYIVQQFLAHSIGRCEADILTCGRPDCWVESNTKSVHEGWIEQIEMIEDLGGLVSCGADSAITMYEYPFKVSSVE